MLARQENASTTRWRGPQAHCGPRSAPLSPPPTISRRAAGPQPPPRAARANTAARAAPAPHRPAQQPYVRWGAITGRQPVKWQPGERRQPNQRPAAWSARRPAAAPCSLPRPLRAWPRCGRGPSPQLADGSKVMGGRGRSRGCWPPIRPRRPLPHAGQGPGGPANPRGPPPALASPVNGPFRGDRRPRAPGIAAAGAGAAAAGRSGAGLRPGAPAGPPPLPLTALPAAAGPRACRASSLQPPARA